MLKLSLDEVRELSSGIKKFLKSTEFTLEGSLNEKTKKQTNKQTKKEKNTKKEKASSKIEKLVQFKFMLYFVHVTRSRSRGVPSLDSVQKIFESHVRICTD